MENTETKRKIAVIDNEQNAVFIYKFKTEISESEVEEHLKKSGHKLETLKWGFFEGDVKDISLKNFM